MKTNETSAAPLLLEGYFAECLMQFAVRECYTKEAAFRAWSTALDYLRNQDETALVYIADNWTLRRIFETAHSGPIPRE